MIHVFVVAPTAIMRAGLRTTLTTADMQVVGEASVPDEVINEGIDVIVVADEMLLEDVGHAVADNTEIALVVLASSDDRPVLALRRLSLRGWSIVPLDATPAQLQASVMAAAQGLVALPTTLAERLQEQRSVVQALQLEAPDESLTAREREVLELLSQGLPNKLIARRLQISEHTVKFHVSSLSAKLGASSRTDAVSRGIRRGLITL